jgi:hypothetical protein
VLEGFSLNRRYPFDSIIRNPLRYTLDKQTREASIDIPALVPGINFHVPGRYPLFSLIISPVIIPDLHYGPVGYQPANNKYVRAESDTKITEWYPVLNGSPETSLQMKIRFTPPDEFFILMLTVGIRFGTIGADGNVQQLKRAGSAKILAVI